VHLYVGRSEEKYKETNESFQLNLLCSSLLLSPLCITGLIGDEMARVHRVKLRVVWVFVQHIVYITLNLSLITLFLKGMRVWINEKGLSCRVSILRGQTENGLRFTRIQIKSFSFSDCVTFAVSFGLSNKSYLVDPASSHMLVSKEKCCLASSYTRFVCLVLTGWLNREAVEKFELY